MTELISEERRRELERQLSEAARNGRVPCAVALLIAESLEIPPAIVGRVADEMQLRFNACQLGCFK